MIPTWRFCSFWKRSEFVFSGWCPGWQNRAMTLPHTHIPKRDESSWGTFFHSDTLYEKSDANSETEFHTVAVSTHDFSSPMEIWGHRAESTLILPGEYPNTVRKVLCAASFQKKSAHLCCSFFFGSSVGFKGWEFRVYAFATNPNQKIRVWELVWETLMHSAFGIIPVFALGYSS